MKKSLLILTSVLLLGCNDASTDAATPPEKPIPPASASQPVSLNDVSNEQNNTPPSTPLPPVTSGNTMNNSLTIEKDNNKQTIELSLTVPDTTWGMEVKDVIETNDELAVLVELSQVEGMMGLMVISELVTKLECNSSEKPVQIYVTGKKWNWENEEPYKFIKDVSELKGRSISFNEVEPSRKGGPNNRDTLIIE